jgi:hypothetical protein
MKHIESDRSRCKQEKPCDAGMPLASLRVLIALACLLSLVCPRRLDAQSPADVEDQTLRAMFSQGLVELALNYVRARTKLDSGGLAVPWWTMREMECHARWAMQDAARAEQHWSDCDIVLEEYKTKFLGGKPTQTDPRWPWMEWQIGRCRLLKAQALLAVHLASPVNSAARDQALELVREILQRMQDLSKEIDRRQPLADRQALNKPTEAPADQLRSLNADSQLLQCEALMIRWQLYPIGSDDRAAALAKVRTTAAEFLRTRSDPAGRASLQFAEAIAELESGDKAALKKLEQLAQRAESLQVRLLAASSLARALARDGQQSRAKIALDLLEQTAAIDASLMPQLVLARIEVALARLEASKAPGQEAELSELVKQAQQLGATYGDYWRTRAEALLVGKLSSESVSDSQLAMDLLLAEVKQLTAKGDKPSLQAAAKKLLQGRDSQAALGKGSAAIKLSSLAATLFRELEAWEDAITALQATTVQFAADSTAAEAHLWVVRDQSQLLRQAPTDNLQREAYVKVLKQQLRLWPEATASQEAKQWLRNWCLASGQPANYRALYAESLLEMLPACKNSELGQSLVLECCEQTLQLSAVDRENMLGKWLPSVDSRAKYPLAAVSKQAALAVVILADVNTSEFPRAGSSRQQNWTEYEENRRSLDPGLLSDFFHCTADIGRAQLELPSNQVSKGWNQLSDTTRASLTVALVDAMDSMEKAARIAFFSSLNLDKNWAGFDRNRLSPSTAAATLRVAHWLGDPTAGRQLKELSEKQRRDGNVQLMYAYWLAEQGDWVNAKHSVTQLAGLSAAGSPLQLSARWALMRFQVASGEQAQAGQAAQQLLASQPNLNPRWLERFKRIAK